MRNHGGFAKLDSGIADFPVQEGEDSRSFRFARSAALGEFGDERL